MNFTAARKIKHYIIHFMEITRKLLTRFWGVKFNFSGELRVQWVGTLYNNKQ